MKVGHLFRKIHRKSSGECVFYQCMSGMVFGWGGKPEAERRGFLLCEECVEEDQWSITLGGVWGIQDDRAPEETSQVEVRSRREGEKCETFQGHSLWGVQFHLFCRKENIESLIYRTRLSFPFPLSLLSPSCYLCISRVTCGRSSLCATLLCKRAGRRCLV